MTPITDNNWTLHYTIGRELAAGVTSGDTIHMPGGRGDLIVLGGRAPVRVNDPGSVTVRDQTAADADRYEVRPLALGLVWVSSIGGRSELPPSAPPHASRYNADAVQQQIERDRRRHRIGRKEERLIHALLKGRST